MKFHSADHEPTSFHSRLRGMQRKWRLLGDGIVERDRRRLPVGLAQNPEVEVLGRAGKRRRNLAYCSGPLAI